MTLARVVEIKRYAAQCGTHPNWAVPSSFSYERIAEQVREHNEAEHVEGVETLD